MGPNHRKPTPEDLNSAIRVFGRRLHHKVIVADGIQCLIGGLNISNRYNDLPGAIAWLDWALFVEGEVARAAFDVCARRAQSRQQQLPYGEAFVQNTNNGSSG